MAIQLVIHLLCEISRDQWCIYWRRDPLTRRTRRAKMADERELRRNLTATHRAIKRARLSAYLAIMGAKHFCARLLVSRQQQLGQQVVAERHRRTP